MARTSNVGATNTSITLLVQLDQGMRASNYTIYIYLNGQQSGDLGYTHYSGNLHWSQEYTFYGLSPGTQYYASAYCSGGVSVSGNYYNTTGVAGPPPTTSAYVSNSTVPTNTSISAVVLLNQGADVARHTIYLYCNGQSSGDLGYRHPNGQTHWSREHTFTGLSPGTNYIITGSVSGLSYVGSYSFKTTGTAVVLPTIPLAQQHSASGQNIYVQVNNYYNATSLRFKPSWESSWYEYPVGYSSYGPFVAPEYGGNYSIAVRGKNTAGESSDKLVGVYAQPRVPTLRNPVIASNTVTFEVVTTGYFTSIDVEMWTAGASSLYSKKTLSWNGSTNYVGSLSFGAMVVGATYLFRTIAHKTGEYSSAYSGWTYIQNTSPPQKPAMRHYSSTGTSITMIIDNPYEATQIRIKPSWSSTWSTYSVGIGSTYTLYAPEYGTEYTVAAIGVNSYGDSETRLSDVMSEPSVPSLSKGTVSGNTINVNVSVGGSFTSMRVEMWDEFAQGEIAYRTFSSRTGTATFGGLKAGATYLFRAISYKTASYGGYSPSSGYGGWLSIKNNVARPLNWTWLTANNGNGHKVAGAIFSLNATEWNEFILRINDFRKYKELPPVTLSSAISGRNVTAAIFNQATNAIEPMRGTGLGQVGTNNKVFASYFNSLMNAINGIT